MAREPFGRPERASKLVDVSAAAALLESGEHLAIGGIWSQNEPAGFAREVIRRGVRDLTLSTSPAGGFAIDLLIAAGCVKRGYLPNVTFEHLGLAPAFRHAVESGAIELVECDEPTLIGGYRAAAAGLPFTPLASLAGSALAEASPWLPSRHHGDVEILEAPPIAPDVVVVHAQEADVYGNARQLGAVFSDRVMTKAAKKAVVVTTDRIVDNEEIRRDPRATTIPGYFVTHVVELPLGAHPCASHARYVADEDHIRDYVAAVRPVRKGDTEAWERYRQRHIDVDHDSYLANAGGVSELMARLGEGRHR